MENNLDNLEVTNDNSYSVNGDLCNLNFLTDELKYIYMCLKFYKENVFNICRYKIDDINNNSNDEKMIRGNIYYELSKITQQLLIIDNIQDKIL